MPAYLTRAILLVNKWRRSLALRYRRIADQVHRQTPVIRQHTARYCRLGLTYTARFLYRIIFMINVLYIRIMDKLRQHVPILWRRTAGFCRLGLAHTSRFIYRIIFMSTVLCIRITELLRYYTPIVLAFIRARLQLAWQAIETFCRFCFRLAVTTARTVALAVTRAFLLAFRFLYGLVCRTGLAVMAGWRWLISRIRHYTPIVLAFIRARLQLACQAIETFCRFCFRLAVTTARTVALAVTRAFLLAFRFLYGLVRRTGLAVMAGWRWLISRIRHYTPIILHATGRALQVTAQGLSTLVRACLQATDRTLRTVALAVLSIITLIMNICRYLLLVAKKTLQQTGQIIHRLLLGLWALSARAGERLYQYALLMRVNKPIGIFLLLWPTMWALWIAAEGTPDLPILLIFIGGVFLMRSAGCVINDLADHDFDAQVSRTRQRPLAAGKVTVREALAVAAVLVLCAFVLVLHLNRLTIGLSAIAVVLATIYPFTKRYTYLPQIFLGLAFGWAVPMAFAAQTGAVPAMAWILLMATVLWALVYDTMYAMVDREEDIMLGIKSTAILFEDADRFIIGVIQGLVLLTLLLVGSRLDFNRFYYAGLAIAGLLFIYQQHLIRDRVPQHCFMAFLNNNWFGAMVFGGIVMNYYYQYG